MSFPCQAMCLPSAASDHNPPALSRLSASSEKGLRMYRNYLAVALRNLVRNKLYSLINIGGLAIGLAAVILIALFVYDELSYDNFWPDADRLYRAETTFVVPGRSPTSRATSPGPLAPTLAREFEGRIVEAARFFNMVSTVTLGDRQFSERVGMVDANFFELFDFRILRGNRDTVLAGNSSLMISETMAIKYFGDSDAVGKTLMLNETPYEIVAVMEDLPDNSHFDSGMIALFEPGRFISQPWVARQWFSASAFTYFKLYSGVDIDEIAAEIPAMLDKHVTLGVPGTEDLQPSKVMKFDLMAVPDIHLYSTRPNNLRQPGNAGVVLTFAGVALLVLLIAGINFTNLSTARATQRAREVAMRKLAGARRTQLISQFLGESLLLTLLGLIIAVAIVEVSLPFYNQFLGKELTLGLSGDPSLFLAMLGIVALVGILAGIYPALVLSGFRPATILQGSTSASSGSTRFRNALVVVQFAISIALIISTSVVYGQSLFARSMDLGFETDNRLVVRGVSGEALLPIYETLKREMLNIPGVVDVTFAGDTLPLENNKNTLVDAPGGAIGGKALIEYVAVDFDFFEGFGIEPVAGRVFSEARRADIYRAGATPGDGGHVGLVINEMAALKLGFTNPEEAVSKVVRAQLGNSGDTDDMLAEIIGVIPDLIMRSARAEVTPMLFYVQEGTLGPMFLTLRPQGQEETVKAIDELWARILPETPIKRNFVSDRVDQLYLAEMQQAQMFFYFSLFAVFVASLGLFGLASFAVEQRTKEIGVRKVMGAGVFDIVRLLVWQFSKPVLVANLIAWPVAGYFMMRWLQGFSQRLDNSVIGLMFVGAGMTAMLIAWATVSSRAFQAARRKPIDALRYE